MIVLGRLLVLFGWWTLVSAGIVGAVCAPRAYRDGARWLRLWRRRRGVLAGRVSVLAVDLELYSFAEETGDA